MSSFSVNLTVAEWEFILEELRVSRQDTHLIAVADAKVDAKDPDATEGDKNEFKRVNQLLKLSNSATKKIQNRAKPSTKNQLLNEISKLKEQIDKQHEELQIIKDKIKSII